MRIFPKITIKQQRAFTLIELMVVMTIIALLMGLAASGMKGAFAAGGLTQSMESLNSELSLARQASTVENVEFEVRFLKMADPDSGRSEEAYRGFQIVKRKAVIDPEDDEYSRPGTEEFEAAVIPVTPIRFFTEGVVLIDELAKSTLLAEASRKGEGTIPIPDSTEAAEFSYFRLTPEGGTDLDRKRKWFVTFANENDLQKETIDNFATLQIEPTTGKLIWFRP